MRIGEFKTVLQCTARVLFDSKRTEDIIVAEEIMAQTKLSEWVANELFEQTDEGRALWRERPCLVDTDLNELRKLAPTTLGGAFVGFLDRYELDYELARLPTDHTKGADQQYMLSRLRQSHDVWHVLTGLGTQGFEEVLLHSFSLGQTGLASSALIVTLGGVKHMVLERRWNQLHPGLVHAFRSGKGAQPLLPVYWERHWGQPLDEIRRRYQIQPLG